MGAPPLGAARADVLRRRATRSPPHRHSAHVDRRGIKNRLHAHGWRHSKRACPAPSRPRRHAATGTATSGSSLRCGAVVPARRLAPTAVRASRGTLLAGMARGPVLLVDDNVDVLDPLADLLTMDGFDVHVAHGGEEALAVAERIQPRVAVIDLGMPGLDGLTLGRKLRERFGPSLRLVAYTGFGLSTDRERTRQAGFDAHVTKPADVAAIQATFGLI